MTDPEAPTEDQARLDAIDAKVEEWHRSGSGALHDYLGMTWDQYAAWVRDPRSILLAPHRHDD